MQRRIAMPQSQKNLTKNAVRKVKSAPEIIVEHALSTAIETVEKAAETDVKRTNKRAEKTAQKLKKAQKVAKAAQNEAKRANNLSHKIEKLNTIAEKTSKVKGVIKEKIQDIIAPQKEISFYYDRRQLVVLTAVYALLAVLVYLISNCLLMVMMYNSFVLLGFLIATQIFTLLALALVLFVTIFPQRLAFINKDGIKIDHNALLKWSDIDYAEERYTSYISRRPFMALHLKKGALKNYRLTFMQHLCKKNIFTPFSIPMYAMRPNDVSQIREIIKRHVKYEDNRN